MSVNMDVRRVESPEAEEIYIAAIPVGKAPIKDQLREIFAGIRKILAYSKAYIMQEWIFVAEGAVDSAYKQRSLEYGDVDDGVSPSFLICNEGLQGSIVGVQVYAVSCKEKPHVIEFQGSLCGRVVEVPGRRYLTLSNVSASQAGSEDEQAKDMLESAQLMLSQYNSDFSNVPRTWMWLGDILSWYGRFNGVRNKFFTKCGLITTGEVQKLPASTGIGLQPARKGSCAMDLIAVLEPADSIKYLPAIGRQHCAFEYGSAFSRAAEAITPAAKTVFISGTASIDINGRTTNIGNPAGQIKETIENVKAVLRDMHCTDNDVVQAIAYCKTAEVEKVFGEYKSRLSWPWITVICDICRPELLFEVEITAASSA